MNIRQFLQHHGIRRNPFSEEDAQTDPVFKDGCIDHTFHPSWDKVYGDPREPATAIVFGRKGSGKTAMRLQIARHISQYNREHPDERVFVVTYDDFNPALDRFRVSQRFHRGNPERLLKRWRLWDHMDSILSLAVTQLVDSITGDKIESNGITQHKLSALPRHLARDLLLLQTCYDQSMAEPVVNRWHKLRRQLKFNNWRAYLPFAVGITTTVVVLAAAIACLPYGKYHWLTTAWYAWIGAILAGCWWYAWRWTKWTWRAGRINKHCRVLSHATPTLRHRLLRLPSRELLNQPLPSQESTDHRYELLIKLQTTLRNLGFLGMIVLVDRVDEPEMVNGDPDRMRALVWPMLDNKFLKHPGLGIKLMLPAELKTFVDREDAAFYERARLDKQNMIPSFEWTPEALLDVANARIAACSESNSETGLFDLLDERVTRERVMQALRDLRVPRHMFKLLYRLFVAHCNAHTEESPVWRIEAPTFETELALYLREQDAFERGLGAG